LRVGGPRLATLVVMLRSRSWHPGREPIAICPYRSEGGLTAESQGPSPPSACQGRDPALLVVEVAIRRKDTSPGPPRAKAAYTGPMEGHPASGHREGFVDANDHGQDGDGGRSASPSL
jgi:hypothetical protein